MLFARIVTALVLAPLVIWAIIALPPIGFLVLISVAFAICAWEWLGLSLLESTANRFVLTPILIAPAVIASQLDSVSSSTWVNVFAMWWLLVPVILFVVQWRQHFPVLKTRTITLLGMGVLSAAILSLLSLYNLQHGMYWVFTVLTAVWAADIGAYISGKLIGGPKLAAFISPGKTWAGFIGGLIVGSGAVLTIIYFKIPGMVFSPGLIALVVITVIVSVGGDLWVSLLKRMSGIKDSGNILPGHGGLLDRLDSLIAAAPVLSTGLLMLGVQ